MLSLQEIQTAYPEPLKNKGRFILREYLQYKILEIIYNSEFANQLIFLGGTCLRIVHGNERFSEDLDFDNTGMSEPAFEEISGIIAQKLKLGGLEVELKTVYKGAYHCHIKLPGILFKTGLSGYAEEKILIQLDTEAQNYDFTPDKPIINKFDVFTQILTVPLPLLLSQKFHTVLNRPRNKGRDFLDIVFILSKSVKPDYKYLELKQGIVNSETLKSRIIQHSNSIDLKEMAKDVEPFLFKPKDLQKVLLFKEIIDTASL